MPPAGPRPLPCFAADRRPLSCRLRRAGLSAGSACQRRHPRAPARRRLAGIIASAATASIARTRISAKCWPAFGASMGARRLGKEAVLADDILAMAGTLGHDLHGLRDRAILLIGFAGGLRRSEIVGLDCGADQTEDGSGWIAIEEKGALVTVRGKTGWREIEIGRGSSDLTCPVVALQAWLRFARIADGPVFRAVGQGKTVRSERLNDRHIARLVKRTALAAGIRGDLPEGDRALRFSGHSLRAGLASSAEIDERYVQKQLGHASAEMTRRYQRRRDRFRVNLTKAAGL